MILWIMDYEKVKAAILQKSDINTETYRQRFHCLNVLMRVLQLLRMLEYNPESAATLADVFVAA